MNDKSFESDWEQDREWPEFWWDEIDYQIWCTTVADDYESHTGRDI